MNIKPKEILILALGGLVIGSMLGIIAAGAYATWARGGDLTNIGFTTILNYLPQSWTTITEPFRTAAMIGGGIALFGAVAVPAIGSRRDLTSHGSARWATEAEAKRAKLVSGIETMNGPIFGKLGLPKSRAKYLTSVSIPHSLIAAPTGAGKGVGIVTPTLLTYPGSIVCLDMKGLNYENTARHRRSIGDQIYKFAPYDPDGKTHRFNPMDNVVAALPERRFTEARRLAASFITIEGDSARGFLGGARDIFAATVLLCIERGTPTIAAVHDALSQPGKSAANLYKLGLEVTSREATSIFNKFSGRDEKHLSAYLSILMDGGLGLWAEPPVRNATAASDFNLKSLRSRPASIYIVIPPDDIETLAPLVRLLFQQTVSILQRTMPDRKKGEKYPVLLLLDEFVTLGRMDKLKSAITTLREYGVRVMIVVQTISSMRDLYGKDGAGTFMANCGIQVFMGPADEETPDYISKAIGDYTQKTRSKSWKGGELTTSYSERTESARLIRPEQVRLLGEEQVVILVQNMLPILAHRVTYWQDRNLKKLYEAQKGELPDPPKIDPYDPKENGSDDGPRSDNYGPVYPKVGGGGGTKKRSDEDSPAPDTVEAADAVGAATTANKTNASDKANAVNAANNNSTGSNETTRKPAKNDTSTGDGNTERPGDVEMMLKISGICDELRKILESARYPAKPADAAPATGEPAKDGTAKDGAAKPVTGGTLTRLQEARKELADRAKLNAEVSPPTPA